ncbi:MAG: hypothetical protein LKF53_07745 [Solobacterium sp.]|jgi:Leucine-rich repeat (LRR) protein|nr:hypothetical protein [Solobacterium sp.]MCH4206267.1 hypothetical protein [Solobacterium sp.]MCH4227698.1 hypothetical protein [Solobacterium sp.]MCH4283125.1 hypothetical protein [Solobacterium sp.]
MKRIISIIAALTLMIGLSPVYCGTTVKAITSINISTESPLPDATIKTDYDSTIAAQDNYGNVSWTINGISMNFDNDKDTFTLVSDWLTFTSIQNEIFMKLHLTGTPTEYGLYLYTIVAMDLSGNKSPKDFTIAVGNWGDVFPDAVFRDYVAKNVCGISDGVNSDTKFTSANIIAIKKATELNVSGFSISDLTGIGNFSALTSLDCSDNMLTSLDVSKLTKLVTLNCNNNNLASLTIGSNTALENLSANNNLLTSLDLGTLPALKKISTDQKIPTLDITGESGAWKYDMSVLNIKNLSKVKIDDDQSATLDTATGVVTFTTADKPSKLNYSYDTGMPNGTTSYYLNVSVVEKVKNLDFVLTCNASNKYTVSVDNVPAGKQLLLIVPVAENGKTDDQIYDKYLQYYTKIMNDTDNIGHSAVGSYYLSSDDFTIKEITNNVAFDVDTDLGKQFARGIGICIADPQENSLYVLNQAGMTRGLITIGTSSGNKVNATAHNVTVTGGTVPSNTAYKGDSVTITASDEDTFDHWTSSTDGVIFKDANSASTTFTMLDKDVAITAVDKAAAHSVKIASGKYMSTAGKAFQTELTGAMTDVTYTADNGYYFPEDYAVTAVNGISVKRASASQIIVSGTPSADTAITLKDAVKKTSQDAPKSSEITDGKGKINGTTAQMEYSLDQIIWKVCTEGSTEAAAGTYYVRYAATDTKNASEAVKVTVTSAVTDDEDDDYQVVNTAVK